MFGESNTTAKSGFGPSRILTLCAVMLIIFCLQTTAAYAEFYTTENYDVTIDVKENKVLYIKEDIKVTYTEPRHGIYRYVPYAGEKIRLIDGIRNVEAYRAKISDIYVESHPYVTYRENGNEVIQIGDANQYVEGQQEYIIGYRYAEQGDKITLFDDLYFNVIPTGWNTAIDSAEITINMPKAFDAGKVEFITAEYGGANTSAVDFTVSGNTIKAKLNTMLLSNQGVTVRILLPENYFLGESNDNLLYALMLLLIVGAPVLSFILWFFFGRDERIMPTVEFYPPTGITSAEIGYIVDGVVDNKDVVSLILYWANAGLIKIIQEGRKDFVLIKQAELPSDAKVYEFTMFNGLFSGRDQVSSGELKETFYSTFAVTKEQLKSHFTANKQNRVYTQNSLAARAIGVLLMLSPIAALTLIGAYVTIQPGYIMILSGVLMVTNLICFSIFIGIHDRQEGMSTGKKMAAKIFSSLFVILLIVEVIAFAWFILDMPVLGAITAVTSLFTLWMATEMKQRSHQSVIWMGKILGLKEFIKQAELDRIKLLVEESPEYFYKILPYAYVLGLTELWAKKFESLAIEPPGWYDGPAHQSGMFNTWIFMNSFNHSIHAMESNISIPPAPQGGGIGGGGGGGSW